MCFLCFTVVFALILFACRGCFCVGVSGGGPRHSNPSRDTGSKRLRNPGEAPEGSTAPKRHVKTSASKNKEPAKGMDEIPQSECIRLRQLNPYVIPCATVRGCEFFWNKQQTLTYLDVIKNTKYLCGCQVDRYASPEEGQVS